MHFVRHAVRRTALAGLGWLALISPAAAAAPVDTYQAIPGVSPEPLTEGVGLRGPDDLEAFLDGVMGPTLRESHIAGAVVAIVKDGELYFAKGYGYADVDHQVPVDATTTLFRVGSISKLFTWTAVMQLVEQGRIDLDADINTYLTQFKIPATFPQPITMRNLMTHSAGFEDGGMGYLVVSGPGNFVPLATALGNHIPARVAPPAVDFNDATMESYSNWGGAVAGLIVANVSGVPFEDYVEKNIFKPLRMYSSTFREPLPPDLKHQVSDGYRFQSGALKAMPFEYVHNFAPAGALSSTAVDMAKFMIAHLNDGAYGEVQILKQETAEAMHSRHLSPSPYLSGWCLGFYEKHLNGYRIIGHGGNTRWFHSDLNLLPEQKLGLFVSYNSASTLPIVARDELLAAFMNRYYPAYLPQLHAPPDFARTAARYTGDYLLNRRSYTKNEKATGLLATPLSVTSTADNALLIGTGPTAMKVIEVKPDVFRAVDRDVTIAFAGISEGNAQFRYFPQATYHRLAWFETLMFQYSVLGVGALCFIAAIVSALRNWKTDRYTDGLAGWARPLAGTLGVTHVVFLVLMVNTLIQRDDISGWPALFRVALVFPLVAVPLTASVVYLAATVWIRKYWGLFGRIQYSVIALASVVFLWSLNYWNLVGFKFG
jgi:CubicO group peptidase (beta-lactamase class C family)